MFGRLSFDHIYFCDAYQEVPVISNARTMRCHIRHVGMMVIATECCVLFSLRDQCNAKTCSHTAHIYTILIQCLEAIVSSLNASFDVMTTLSPNTHFSNWFHVYSSRLFDGVIFESINIIDIVIDISLPSCFMILQVKRMERKNMQRRYTLAKAFISTEWRMKPLPEAEFVTNVRQMYPFIMAEYVCP